MTPRRRAVALGLLVAALALAALGQFYFTRRPEYAWDGLVFYALAAACFLLAWRSVAVPPSRGRQGPRLAGWLAAWLREQPVPAALFGLGLVLSALATLLSRGRSWNEATNDVVALWLLGIAAVGAVALYPVRVIGNLGEARPANPWQRREWNPALRWRARLRAVPRETWLEVAAVATLTLPALLLRAVALDRIPYTLSGDEAWFGLTARQVLYGELRNPFVTGHLSMPTLFYWPISWAMRLAGDNMIGLRLPAALVGAATVPLLYLLARDLWGRRVALLSAVFLATYDYHLHYSRLGLNNAWDPLFAVLAFWALERGLHRADEPSRRRCFVLVGLVVGLSFYFYTGARLLPALVGTVLAFSWVQRRFRDSASAPAARLGGPVLLMGLALLVVAGPILSFALEHPDDWNARINQVGIVQSGWLAREMAISGKSMAQILAEQFLRAAGAFNVFPDRTDFYGISRPLLSFPAALFAGLGMAWALARWRERRHFVVLIWFWAVIVGGGMLTESPPSSQRLVMAIPAVALLVAIGLDRSVHLAGRLLQAGRRWEHLLLGLLMLVLAVGSLLFYFGEYTPSRRYGSENGETATMIGHYAEHLDASYRAYFFGPPRISWGFGSMTFLAPQVEAQDVVEPLRAPPEFVDTARNATFIFLPERIEELSWVQSTFPGGQLHEIFDSKGRLRFTAYEVRP